MTTIEAAERPPSVGLRLRRPAEFSVVFASRQAVRGECFELRFVPNGGIAPRLGFVMPKRLARHAVMRNLLKRLAREAFRQAAPSLPALDMVLRLARQPQRVQLDSRDLRRAWREEIDGLFAKLSSRRG